VIWVHDQRPPTRLDLNLWAYARTRIRVTSSDPLAAEEVLRARNPVEHLLRDGSRDQRARSVSGLPKSPWPGRLVELTGFEPVTPSLRKMRSNGVDLGQRHPQSGLWGGCGASDVMQREML